MLWLPTVSPLVAQVAVAPLSAFALQPLIELPPSVKLTLPVDGRRTFLRERRNRAQQRCTTLWRNLPPRTRCYAGTIIAEPFLPAGYRMSASGQRVVATDLKTLARISYVA